MTNRSLKWTLSAFALARWAAAGSLLLAGCGADGITVKEKQPANDGSSTGGCLHDGDCTGTQVCLFKTCSEQCVADKDCKTAGTHCLKVGSERACVSSSQAACTKQEDCPAETRCAGGECKAECDTASNACPEGQRCAEGVCVSMVEDAGSGGSTGSGGAVTLPDASIDSGSSAGGKNGSGGMDAAIGLGGSGGILTDTGTDTGGTASAGAGGAGTGGAPTTGPVANIGDACTPPSAYACAGHAQKGQLVCSNGTWTAYGGCTTGQLCDTSAQNVGFCEPVAAGCVGKQPGETICSGQDVQECGPDLITVTPVTTCANQACVNGACTGVCAPGQTQCNTNGVETCTAGGQWGAASACQGQACVSGACQGSCEPGTKRCNSKQPQTCDVNGAWQDTGAVCANVCNGGDCSGSCSPSTKRCNGLTPQTCDGAGTWQDGQACSFLCTGAGVCSGVCTPGTKRCAAGNTVETCTAAGQWGTPAACINPTPVCQDGACFPPENCGNGVDDDGDGNPDCADTDCTPTMTCVPDPGATFTAGTWVDAAASCPADFGGGTVDINASMSNPSSCFGCQCLGSITCSADVYRYSTNLQCSGDSAMSGGTYLGTVTGTYADQASAVTSCLDTSVPAGYAKRVSSYTTTANPCTPTGSPYLGAGWAVRRKFCSAGSLGSGCTPGYVCAPKAPAQCVLAASAQSCPAGYTPDGTSWYTGYTEGRTCGACSCGSPTGGSCSTVDVGFFSTVTNDCPALGQFNGTDSLGPNEKNCNSNFTVDLGVIKFASGSVQRPTCAASSPVSGSPTLTGRQTMCCL